MLASMLMLAKLLRTSSFLHDKTYVIAQEERRFRS